MTKSDPRDLSDLKISDLQTWSLQKPIAIPTTDVVSYAFERCEIYDLDQPIFVNAYDKKDVVTARSARTMVRRLVKGLHEQGLEKGDCVCLHSYNSISYPLLWLGVIGAGGCVCGSNPAYTADELVHHLEITSTKFIITHGDCLSPIAAAARQCQIPGSRLFVLGSSQPSDGFQSAEILFNRGESEWRLINDDEKDVVAVLGMTSGTTGLPKAAAFSHAALIAQCDMIQEYNLGRSYPVSQLVCLPVFHAFAGPIGLVLPLRCGWTTYLMPRFKVEDFIQAIQAFSVTEAAVVPTIVSALLRVDVSRQHLLASLRYIICAGAPMNAHVQSRLYTCLSSNAIIAQCWGMTEAGWVTAFNSHERDISGSVGRLLRNVELKVVDSAGRTISQTGRQGAAYIRSPGMFLGYRNDALANQNAFDDDGFYRTGDIVHLVDDKVYIDGREKEIMKVKGWQVSPTELESVVIEHPEVADVAVAGVTQTDCDGVEETLLRAYVVRKTPMHGDLPLTEEALRAFVRSRVVTFKRLTGGVVFVDGIPRSTTGKILRRLLMELPLIGHGQDLTADSLPSS